VHACSHALTHAQLLPHKRPVKGNFEARADLPFSEKKKIMMSSEIDR
jgi:hypothetical protein